MTHVDAVPGDMGDGTVEAVQHSAPAWPPVQHPFQVTTFAVFTLLGVGWMVGDSSRAMYTYLGAWALLWDAVLILLGLCGLLAAVTAGRDEPLSLLTERIALGGIGAFSLMYSVAIAIPFEPRWPWVSAVVFGILVPVACGWRLRQVQRRIAWLRLVASIVPRDTASA